MRYPLLDGVSYRPKGGGHFAQAARFLVALGWLVASGCGGAEPTGETTTAPAIPSAVGSEKPTVMTTMMDHFAQLTMARDALIAGRIDDAGVALAILSNHEPAVDQPAGWGPHAILLRESAGAGADKRELVPVATALAITATACGACHAASNGGPTFEAPPLPPKTHGPRARMRRHVWAAERLWEALVTPSDDAWRAGLEVLNRPPLPVHQLPQDRPIPEEVLVMAERIGTLGDRGGQLSRPVDRAGLYAELLGTCARCHRALSTGPASADDGPAKPLPIWW